MTQQDETGQLWQVVQSNLQGCGPVRVQRIAIGLAEAERGLHEAIFEETSDEA